jgi:alkanesulfonate monooxygenase SsuD/methylene tetrahydromethanopterin reductase-like flavin-dependent oxidoreductase (luciferase family)
VGIGVGGEYPAEFEAVHVPMAERGARTDAALPHLRERLGDTPIFFGGSSGAALRRAAELGDGWIGYLLGPESFARRRERLCELRRSGPRRAEPVTCGMLVPFHITDQPRGEQIAAAAWSRLTAATSPMPERLFAAGAPDEVAQQLHRYRQAGCTEIVLSPADHGQAYLHQLELLANDVVPRLRALEPNISTT